MPVELREQKIGLAVDSLIFTIKDGELHVLLIQMKKKPYVGAWAFPGGLIGNDETTEQAAQRILKEQTGVAGAYLEQLGTFDEPRRDASSRIVSVAYFALLPDANIELLDNAKYGDVRWWPTSKLPAFAYDHKEMAEIGLQRLRVKLGYTNVVWSLLPQDFSLTQLQTVYEAILGHTLDKRNFRRKVLSLGLIKPSSKKVMAGKHRPAQLYHFKDRRLVYIDML